MRSSIVVQDENGSCYRVANVEAEFAEAVADAVSIQLHEQEDGWRGCVTADTAYGEYVVDWSDVFEWREDVLPDRIGTAIFAGA